MIELNYLKLTDIAAKSTLNDSTTRWIYESIDYALAKRHLKIMNKFFLNLENLNETELDYLLWEYHVDYIGENTTIKEKIELIKKSILTHFNKGTIGSIKSICDILFGNSEITEWFEYGGDPGYFKVSTLGNLKNERDYIRVLEVINEYKNVRSWLEKISFKRNFDIKIYNTILHEKQIINTLTERDFELPWLDGKINTEVISLVVKQNNIGMKG